jgi:hypothetical protein
MCVCVCVFVCVCDLPRWKCILCEVLPIENLQTLDISFFASLKKTLDVSGICTRCLCFDDRNENSFCFFISIVCVNLKAMLCCREKNAVAFWVDSILRGFINLCQIVV